MNEYRKLSRHTKKIVRHDDEEYLSVAKFRTNQKEDYLGEHALSKYNNGKDKNLHQAELERVFMRDQVSIGLMMRLNTFSRSYVANIIRNVMNSSVITQKYFDKIHKEYNSAYFLAKAESLFTNAEIPDEVFASILKEHHKQMSAERDRVLAQAELLKQKFITNVEYLIHNGKLSPTTDIAEVSNRLNMASIRILDPLNPGFDAGTRGSHDGFNISFRPFARNDEDIEDTYFHEAVHAGLAGRKRMLYDSGIFATVSHKKMGVSLANKGDRSYTWLDEAITEKIKMLLLGNNKTISYSKECALLDNLLEEGKEHGLEWLTFAEAYQEDYIVNRNNSEKNRLPKMREMFKKIQKTRPMILDSHS